jgi:uncharacterized protein GlcG (DUF336 family)
MKATFFAAAAALLFAFNSDISVADDETCVGLPTPAQVRAALENAVQQDNGGLGNDMWATVVNRSGKVCLVVNSAANQNAIWLGSRVISAQKANTGNAFSLPKGASGTAIALSSANLYAATQPGGSLFGLQESNPVNAAIAYERPFDGGAADSLVGERIGGINVFGGGLALYNSNGARVGGLGVSGDTSCADHFVAWRVRRALVRDFVPGGVHPTGDGLGDDNMIQDIDAAGNSASGFGHPTCLNNRDPNTLPAVRRPT